MRQFRRHGVIEPREFKAVDLMLLVCGSVDAGRSELSGLFVQQLRFATLTLALVIARHLHGAGIVPQHQRYAGCCKGHHQDEAIGHQQTSLDR